MVSEHGNIVVGVHPQRLKALESRNQQRHELLTALKNLADMVHYSRRPDVAEDFKAEALQGALVFAEAIITKVEADE